MRSAKRGKKISIIMSDVVILFGVFMYNGHSYSE
jgi:hypothetical protein